MIFSVAQRALDLACELPLLLSMLLIEVDGSECATNQRNEFVNELSRLPNGTQNSSKV